MIHPVMLLCACFLVLAGSACKRNGIKVQTENSEVRSIYARVSESGVIQPTIEVPVAPDVSGEVVFLPIQEGQKVKKGDLLLTIRPDDYRAQLEQAAAALNRAQATYLQAKATASQSHATLMQDSVNLNRTKKLFEDKVISRVEFENAQLQYNVSKSQYEGAKFNVQSSYYAVRSAEATRKQARQNLDRTNIYATMDGTITLLDVELGQRVVGTGMMSGTEILKIADLSAMEVVVEINENDIVNVNLGDSAQVEVDAFPDAKFYGEVTEIAYSATVAGMATTDQVTNFEVKVKINPKSYKNPEIFQDKEIMVKNESPFRPGMTSVVEVFTREEKDVVTVPIQAVTLRKAKKDDEDDDTEQEVVFTFNNGKVKEVPVETGISDDTYIHIRDGIDADKEVVVGPYSTLTKILRDSMSVEISKGKESFARSDR